MKILVTGATGFLGKFLCKALKEKKHEVYEVNSRNCDLTHSSSLAQFNNTEIKFDRIYHLAAWTQAGDFCLKYPGDQWLINQKINTNVLSYWKEYQKKAKLIAMGTSCGYDPALPLIEDLYLKGRPIDSLFTYAMTKRMLLSGLISLNKQYGMNYLYLIPSTLYGPLYHEDKRQMHFIFDLIRKIIKGRLYGDEVVLWGDGNQKRELIHVEDFVKYMLELSDKVENESINIGEGKEHSIREYAKSLCDIINFPFTDIKFDESKYVGARSKVLDISKLKKIIPTYKLLPYKKGLEETTEWFFANKEKMVR